MRDFSIENSVSQFHSDKTKEYFQEVKSSFFNGNSRAAIVTLYSVVITDLLIKLEILTELYDDKIAEAILNETKTFQAASPTNPEWEKDLIEKVKNRTSIIDNVDYAHIQALKNDRHLCAHPVLDKEDKLYTPNSETVASHMRNMIESIFTKAPLLSKKILSTALIDISSKSELLIDDDSLDKYISSKYLRNLTVATEIQIFRDLWKFVFKLDNEECENNRIINFRFLYLLYQRNTFNCIEKIKNEQEYFSNILESTTTINLLIRFIAENEFLYNEFREDVHLFIAQQVEKDTSAKLVAWFLNKSIPEHLKQVKSLIKDYFEGYDLSDASGQAYQRIIKICYAKGFTEEANQFIIWRYENVANYNAGDRIFSFLVYPNLDKLNEEMILELCSKADGNSQVYDRKQAKEDHKKLRKHIEKQIGDTFEFDKYANLF